MRRIHLSCYCDEPAKRQQHVIIIIAAAAAAAAAVPPILGWEFLWGGVQVHHRADDFLPTLMRCFNAPLKSHCTRGEETQ